MVANTSSRRHPLQHEVLVSPISEEINYSPVPSIETKSKIWEPTVHHVPSWPEEARTLKKHTWLTFVYGLGDLILVIIPLYFILLAIATIFLNGKPTLGNAFGSKVEFAMSLGPTMFPIIFAAISGRSMKMIARYLAEKGTKISADIGATYGKLTLVGVNLLFLWALSPLGGQASLRLMQRTDRPSFESNKLRYLTTGPAGPAFGIMTEGFQRRKYAEAGSLYNAALLAPLATKIGPQDIWGNVKIPSIDALNESASGADGWLDVPSRSLLPETYSSLVGVPIVGLSKSAESNFTLEYNYLAVNCNPFTQEQYPGQHGTDDATATNYAKMNKMIPGYVWRNKSEDDSHPFDAAQGRASFLIDTPRDLARGAGAVVKNRTEQDILMGRLDGFFGNYNRSRLSQVESETPRQLTFASVYGINRGGDEQGLSITNCSLFQHHVEASVRCTGTECAVDRLRKSRTDTRPNALTQLEYFSITKAIAKEFPTAIKFNEGSSPTELFMMNTSAYPFTKKAGRLFPNEVYANLSDLSPEVFSRRLSLVLNTYTQLSTQSTGYFGSLTRNLSAYGPDTLPVTDINAYLPANLSATEHTWDVWSTPFQQKVIDLDYPFLGATTTATSKSTTQIFACNFAWVALLLASSIIILITGLVAVVLKRRTLGPEMFGFVASMTYENPWLNLPTGGTMLDSMERARLLKDIEVQIGDVRGNEEIGHIAFAAGVPLRKLERGRLYC
ncbi:hypothetical protein E8E12_006936 [Didymella heteroderae]|uniref:Uncharacterized protein n=1 Tax=Didymella heteroderae TaxID=1769908 RepID=A0A9P5C1V9_9PLEO|nr:hypothetical protein E8E12_006936 [Didymella heteroderae]